MTTSTDSQVIDQTCISAIRALSIDAIQAADSGHPGTPMGIAPATFALWQKVLRFDPSDPIWPNRDRYVLSSGHASALLWSMLHLTRVQAVNADYETVGRAAVTLEDLKRFRQLDSHAPGHPEYRWTSGVEATTGPLGTGAATSVGMAVAQQWLAERYNRDGFPIFDYDVYSQLGDGCMMEGITSEAASFAAHQGLSNLCWIYDSNRVTIEGHTDIAFTEDVVARFVGYGWNVTMVGDANDLSQILRALHDFKKESGRPTLIVLHSHIGYGTPVEDSPKAHGSPLGVEGVKATKRFIGWPEEPDFYVPDEVYDAFRDGIGARGRSLRDAWQRLFADYGSRFPELADEINRIELRELPDGWDVDIPQFPADPKGLASRESSATVLNAIAQRVPWLLGGSADLAPSTKTALTFAGAGDFQRGSRAGRNFHFGIRENAAAAIANGMALSKVRPYWSGFLIFSDFARGPIRLSALMEIPVINIFTHDSIGVGEDGPTHQPVEQLVSLRAVPGLLVFRPADANEVAEAWRTIMQCKHLPCALVLSRQALPTIDRSVTAPASGLSKGAYVLADPEDGVPELILIATGSEVSLALDVRAELSAEGIRTRVVSMPCSELFDEQPEEYRERVIPSGVRARVAIEQASTLGWHRYVGDGGAVVGMHTFGASAPLSQLTKKFGFTPDAVADTARATVESARTYRKGNS